MPQHRDLGATLVTQPQPDAGEQLLEAKRLAHVVIGAAFKTSDGVADRVPGGQDDDRDRAPGLPKLAQHGEPVTLAQADVQHQEIELAGQCIVVGRLAVADDGRREAVRSQPLLEERGDPHLVLGDQDAVHVAAFSVSGISTVNVAPSPGGESTLTCPP